MSKRTLDDAFDEFQQVVNTDPADLKEARRRRDLFDDAYCTITEVLDVFCSGSLARRTHIDPIHDVDTVIKLDPKHFPDWAQPGSPVGVDDALAFIATHAMRLLGVENGTVGKELLRAEPRNHAVRCHFRDRLRDYDFTVDAMPALPRAAGGLWVPEHKTQQWIATNPQVLITLVSEQWALFVPLVRLLKYWARLQPTEVKSLLVEVLALDCLLEAPDRPTALAGFFQRAVDRINSPVLDPAKLCGPIQPDLDVSAL